MCPLAAGSSPPFSIFGRRLPIADWGVPSEKPRPPGPCPGNGQTVCAFYRLTAFFLAWVSVGDWCEDGLHWLGYQERPHWLPGVVGIAAYIGLGIAGPAYLGYYLIGWPGVFVGPLCALVIIAILGRW